MAESIYRIKCKPLISNLIEPEMQEKDIWEKQTLKYVAQNFDKVKRSIANKGLKHHQVDEIMSDLILYLEKAGDYDVYRANNVGNDGTISLENYISISIKFCIQRYRSNLSEQIQIFETSVIRDGEERDIIDNIPDKDKISDVDLDLDSMLHLMQGARYKYGIDIYMLLYINLLVDGGKNKEKYDNILQSLGISTKDLKDTERKVLSESEALETIKSVCCCSDTKEAISKIEKYVYAHKIIKDAITSMV